MKQLQRKDWQALQILILGVVISLACSTSALCINVPLTEKKEVVNNLTSLPQQNIQFDAKENKWLETHKTIKVGTSQYPPLTYMDDFGSMAGISADYLKLISEKTGLVFDAQYLAWPELMKQSKSKEIDLFSGLKNPQRTKYLNFTEPYLNVSYVVINRLTTPFFSYFSSLNGQKVAVVRNWTVHKLLETKYPAIDIVPFDTVPQALKAVSTRRADAYIGDLLTANFQIQKNVLTNLKVAAPAPFKDDFVRFATRKDWPELSSILDKCIRSISREQHDIILNNWLQLRFEKGFNWLIFWKWGGSGGVVLVLCIAIVVFWNRRLAKEILVRTKYLEQSEEKYRDLVNSSPDLRYRTDTEGRITFISPSAQKIIGYTVEEANGMKIGELYVHHEEMRRFLTLLQKDDNVAEYEAQLQRKDGSVWWASTNAHFFKSEDDILLGVEGVIRDVTERKLVEEVLRETKERLTTFMDSATDGFILFDSELYHLEMNKTALEITGLKRKDVIGRNLVDVMPDIKETPRYDAYKKVMHTGVPYQVTDLTNHPLTGDKHIELKAFKVGEGLGIIFTDITKRIQTEDELEKYREHLEQLVEERNKELKKAQLMLLKKEKLAAIGQLSGSVAHDIRNPLGTVSNSIFYLKKIGFEETDERVKKHIQIMDNELKRADEIITDLMDFSRQNVPSLVEGDVTNLIEKLICNLSVPDNIKLKTNFTPNVTPFPFDSSQLSRVFSNLIINAIQAMADGGELSISTQNQDESVFIGFTDTGSGISDENIEKIFEPLFTTKAKGVGLGLSIVKTFIEKHDGSIEVDSDIGKGTSFTICLPTRKNDGAMI